MIEGKSKHYATVHLETPSPSAFYAPFLVSNHTAKMSENYKGSVMMFFEVSSTTQQGPITFPSRGWDVI
jgi:hypothetical protein